MGAALVAFSPTSGEAYYDVHKAINDHEWEVVESLVGSNPVLTPRILNTLNADGFTPLMTMCKDGSAPLGHLQFLIESGADINIIGKNKDARFQSALHCAAARGEVNYVKCLLSSGADPSVENRKGDHALEVICQHDPDGHKEIDSQEIQSLLLNALVSSGDKGSAALLFHGVKHHDFTTMIKLLEEDPSRVHRHDSAMKNLLIISSQVRFTKGVRYLLKSEFDTLINFRDLGDRTALWHACRNGDLVIAKLLLNAGADPTLMDANDLKPVDMIPEGDKELRSLLKEAVGFKHYTLKKLQHLHSPEMTDLEVRKRPAARVIFSCPEQEELAGLVENLVQLRNVWMLERILRDFYVLPVVSKQDDSALHQNRIAGGVAYEKQNSDEELYQDDEDDRDDEGWGTMAKIRTALKIAQDSISKTINFA